LPFPGKFDFLALFLAQAKISFCREISLQVEALTPRFKSFITNMHILAAREVHESGIRDAPATRGSSNPGLTLVFITCHFGKKYWRIYAF
jgi:hypothetical protein